MESRASLGALSDKSSLQCCTTLLTLLRRLLLSPPFHPPPPSTYSYSYRCCCCSSSFDAAAGASDALQGYSKQHRRSSRCVRRVLTVTYCSSVKSLSARAVCHAACLPHAESLRAPDMCLSRPLLSRPIVFRPVRYSANRSCHHSHDAATTSPPRLASISAAAAAGGH